MICKKCNTDNITKAGYCKNCGMYFLPEEREAAYGKTIYGKIEKLEKWHGYATLDFITGHPVFKTLVLVLILLWGLSIFRAHGGEMTILDSDSYEVQRHESTGDYYVLTKEEMVSLELYFPKETEYILFEMKSGDQVLEEKWFTAEEEILLETNEAVYYRIEADYGKSTEDIIVYVIEE